MLERIRRWDLAAAARVTHYIANSELTRERIHAAYGRDATIIHPPVEIDWLKPGTPEDFFLVVTELAPHKRVHVALEAARLAGKRIKVAGAGPELPRLRSRFGDSAEFLGRVSTDELARLYPRAVALVVPNVEEFGIAAVEAQAAGRPVLAVNEGGTRETVTNGETGVLVDDANAQTFAEALRDVDFEAFSPEAIRTNAKLFSKQRFIKRFPAEIARLSDSRTEGVHTTPR
jgi:glycosyltransferase involved in cell wall biosynthesis